MQECADQLIIGFRAARIGLACSLRAVMWHAMGVVSKTDENGNFIVEVCGQPNMKMARHFLEWQRPEKWGKRRKGTSSTELYMVCISSSRQTSSCITRT